MDVDGAVVGFGNGCGVGDVVEVAVGEDEGLREWGGVFEGREGRSEAGILCVLWEIPSTRGRGMSLW
ncbi:MAG: hypothetical protein RML49_00025 [Verrucomicrobiae bacterium]|nr:hypothetical protein [Verrucomicrobiae bacterium]